MKSWTEELPFFSYDELGCKHCGMIKLDLQFAAALVGLRYEVDHSMTPSSVCRCDTHNDNVGGHPNSLHKMDNTVRLSGGTCAADILWENWPTDVKLNFAMTAWRLGFSLGLSKQFCHVDGRFFIKTIALPKHIFHYDSWTYEISDQQIRGEIV